MQKSYNLKSIYSLDVRAISLVRILLGLLLLTDLFIRSKDLKLHYTDEGVLPIDLLVNNDWLTGFFSIHTISGSIEWQAFLFIVHAILGITLVLGFKSKWSLFLCWFLLISLHNRNPLVLNSGDVYFRLLLFWCLFLPVGAHYSVDAMKMEKSASIHIKRFFNIGTVGFITQIMLIYLVGVMLKSSYEWLHEGSALYYALSIDQMVRPLGSWLLGFPEILKYLTFGTLLIEFIAPILFLIPVNNSLYRSIGIALLISLHIGIQLTLHVGLFSFVCIIALLGLTPTSILDYVEQWAFRQKIATGNTPVLEAPTQKVSFIAGTALLVYILIWNIQTLPAGDGILPDILKVPAHVLRIDQNWGMFAPYVFKSDGWYIFEGKTTDGRTVDLFQDKDLVESTYINHRPDYVFYHFKRARWRKLMEVLYRKESEEYYIEILKAVKSHWEELNKTKVNYSALIFIYEPTQPLHDPSVRKTITLTEIKKAQ